MKMIVKAVDHCTAEGRLISLSQQVFDRPLQKGLGLWIDDSSARDVYPTPEVLEGLKSFRLMRIWLRDREPSHSKFELFIRGQCDRGVFLVFDLAEQGDFTGQLCPFWADSVLGSFWQANTKVRAHVQREPFLFRALKLAGGQEGPIEACDYQFPHWLEKHRLVLNEATCEDWFAKAGAEAWRFVREQKRIAQYYTCINIRANGKHNSCLWMWRATMLGNFLEKFGLS